MLTSFVTAALRAFAPPLSHSPLSVSPCGRLMPNRSGFAAFFVGNPADARGSLLAESGSS